jgi:hypothetical protein
MTVPVFLYVTQLLLLRSTLTRNTVVKVSADVGVIYYGDRSSACKRSCREKLHNNKKTNTHHRRGSRDTLAGKSEDIRITNTMHGSVSGRAYAGGGRRRHRTHVAQSG